jgi:hypothetical protein
MVALPVRTFFALPLILLVGGCLTTSPEQQAKRNEERCLARGYQPKSDEFNDCVVRIETERGQRMESNRRQLLEKPDNPTTGNRGY